MFEWPETLGKTKKTQKTKKTINFQTTADLGGGWSQSQKCRFFWFFWFSRGFWCFARLLLFSLGSWCFPKLFVVISRLLQFFLLFCVFTKLSCRLQATNPSNSPIHQKCQEGRLHLLLAYESNCYPKGCAAPGQVQCQCNTRGSLSKLKRAPPQAKINVTSKSPVGDISVVTLIRTDTTLDHSQKAEKV